MYEIAGAESRMLATVGAFRVVAESDLRDGLHDARRAQRHLEQEGLLRSSSLSSDDRAIVLTDRGRDLLEVNRYERDDRPHEPRARCERASQKPGELTHDSMVYRAYQRAEERLRGQGGRVRREGLDYELTSPVTSQFALRGSPPAGKLLIPLNRLALSERSESKGEMSEWLKEHAWKAKRATLTKSR